MKTIDAPSWLSLVLPMAWQLRSGNIQIQFEVQFEVEEVEYEVEVAQNVAIVMLSLSCKRCSRICRIECWRGSDVCFGINIK